MNIKAVLDYKKNKIINIMIEKGVQPEELSENIWNKEYKSINIARIDESIVCSLTFIDNDNEINMIYKYNNDKKLIQIEEISNSIKTVLWDRNLKLQELINDLCEFLKINYREDQIERILNTLPEEVKILIQVKTKIA